MANKDSLTMQERLSALADGELCADDIGALLDAMEAAPEAYEAWTLHHANAAAVRGERISAASGDIAFWQSLQDRLEVESMLAVSTMPVSQVMRSAAKVANEPFWRIRSVASLAIVLAVGGLVAVLWPGDDVQENLAVSVTGPAPAVAAIPVVDGSVMLRNPELDALMAAHQQMGGHSAWQAPSGFLRNATYERPAR